jgi:hypothetical protein
MLFHHKKSLCRAGQTRSWYNISAEGTPETKHGSEDLLTGTEGNRQGKYKLKRHERVEFSANLKERFRRSLTFSKARKFKEQSSEMDKSNLKKSKINSN